MKHRIQPPQVAEADTAVDSYLQALLKDVEEYVPATVESQAESQRTTVKVERAVVETEERQEVNESVPSWAEGPFQCLMFKVNGITMSIPLTSLLTILEWKEEPSVIPGQPDWHLGITQNRDAKIGIVDTARIVMPDRLSTRLNNERQTGGYILIVGDGRWGLACDSISNTETLTKDMVRWKTGLGKRPWLAGMVSERLCALMDVDAMLGMINA